MRNFFIFLRAANLGNRGSRDITTPVGADSISAREPRGNANTPGGISGLRAAAARRLASETRLRAQ